MKQFLDNSELSPVELAKHLMSFRSLTETKNDFEAIKNSILPDQRTQRVEQIITGLEQEDEFAILCRLMETCESISRISQTPIVENGEIAPDFLASFSPGCSVTGKSRKDINVRFNCFVEVKSTKAKVFKISKNDLAKRKAFATRYRIPLVFAVRFLIFQSQGFWVMVDATRLEQNGRRISVGDVIGNLNHVLFDDYGVTPHPHLHVAHYYDATKQGGIRHKKYGPLFKTVLLLPDEKPIVLEDSKEVLVNALLDSYEFKEVQVIQNGPVTCVVSFIGFQMRFLSDILFRINHLAVDSDGTPAFDATRVLTRLDNKEKPPTLITRSMVEWVVSFLNRNRDRDKLLFLKMGIGEPADQEKRLRRLTK